jgi:hypothetical protein
MVTYNCETCGCIFNNITNFQTHIQSDKACEIFLNKSIECETCGNKYTTKRAKDAHVKKFHPDNVVNLEMELDKAKEIIKNLEEKLNKKPGRPKKVISITTTSNGNNSGNIGNINTGTQNINNINKQVIINFGEEDITKLTKTEKLDILNKKFMSLVELVKVLHCNNKYPEMRNIFLSNLRSNDIYVYQNGKFRTKDKKETLDNLIKDRAEDIQELMEDETLEISVRTQQAITKLLTLIFEEDEEQFKKTREELIRIFYDENKFLAKQNK